MPYPASVFGRFCCGHPSGRPQSIYNIEMQPPFILNCRVSATGYEYLASSEVTLPDRMGMQGVAPSLHQRPVKWYQAAGSSHKYRRPPYTQCLDLVREPTGRRKGALVGLHPCIAIYPILNECMIRRQPAGRQAPIEEWDLQLLVVDVSSGPAWQCTSESGSRPLMQTHDSHVGVALEGPSPRQYSGGPKPASLGREGGLVAHPIQTVCSHVGAQKAVGASRLVVGRPRLSSQPHLDNAHADRSFCRDPGLGRDSHT